MNKSNALANIVFVITIVLISKITLFFIEQRKEVMLLENIQKTHQLVLSDELIEITIDVNK